MASWSLLSFLAPWSSSDANDLELCPSCARSRLSSQIRGWPAPNNSKNTKESVLLTWNRPESFAYCQLCRFLDEELSRVGQYADQLGNLGSFVGTYKEIKALTERAEQSTSPLSEEIKDNHHGSTKSDCLLCKPVPLATITSRNVHSLSRDLVQSVEDHRDHGRGDIESKLSQMRPFCKRIIDVMQVSLQAHAGSSSCLLCKELAERTESLAFRKALDGLNLTQKKALLSNHTLDRRTAKPTVLRLDNILQVKVKMSNEGSWNGLVLQEYGLDAKTPAHVRLAYAEGKSVDRRYRDFRDSLTPNYRQNPRDSTLFVPIRPNTAGYARPMKSEFDVELLTNWLERCRHCHGAACQKQSKEYPKHLILIDTEQMKLQRVPSGSPPPYFALSYVWGGIVQSMLRVDSLDAWQEKGSLTKVLFPQKILDAMTITRNSGVRYLWVDALCIVQDDDYLRDVQINQMYLIYHIAEITIVAADGDRCDEGLAGVSNSQGRIDAQAVYEVMGTPMARVPREPKYMLESSVWRTRGWTFQEEICSLRSLVFLPNVVIFSCPTAVWREDLCLEDVGGSRLSSGLRSLPTALGDDQATWSETVAMFRDVVKQYTQRTLTRATDMENAFAGISGMMESLVGPLYHGIPEQYFAEVVGGCWFWDMCCVRRPGFPSWSWTGWLYTKEQADTGIDAPPSLGQTEGLLHFFRFGLETEELRPREARDSIDSLRRELREHFEPDLAEMESTHALMMSQLSSIPKGLISFYTSMATLEIRPRPGHGGSANRVREYFVLGSQNRDQLTSLSLPDGFVQSEGKFLHFIAIAARGDGALRLMLVKKEGDVYYKVNVTSPRKPVSEAEWWNLKPMKKLIIMG